MTDAQTPESHASTGQPEQGGDSHAKPEPKRNAVGQREPEHDEPVARPDPDRPVGERQDGPGAAPPRSSRTDAHPAGSTHAQRTGDAGGQGQAEEPDAAHRGQPARFDNGEAQGSGASAGGTRHGAPEDPDTDSVNGSGREGLFHTVRGDQD
jgi:hypothetical protein